MRIAILCVALVVSSFSSADEARPWVISTEDIAAISPVDATVIDRAMVKVSTRDLLDAEALELVLLDKTTNGRAPIRGRAPREQCGPVVRPHRR
jgi:hypothetical protein